MFRSDLDQGEALAHLGACPLCPPGLDRREGNSRDSSLLEDSLSPAGPVDLNLGQEGDVRCFGIEATSKEHSQVVTEIYLNIHFMYEIGLAQAFLDAFLGSRDPKRADFLKFFLEF